jgi:hypothetical protein
MGAIRKAQIKIAKKQVADANELLRPMHGYITTDDNTVLLPASCTLITEKGTRKSVVSSLAWRCSRSSTESVRAALAVAGIDPKIEGEWECAYTDQNGVEHVIGIKYEDGTTTRAPVKNAATKEAAVPKAAAAKKTPATRASRAAATA